MAIYKKVVKPLADRLFAFLLLIVLTPFLIILILLFYVNNKGEIFFLQKRPGLNCKPFFIIKFKTMKDVYDKNGKQLPDEQRITKLGKFVRSYSIDEILQLVNVLKGEMSFVGPRPLMMEYLSRYSPEQNRRHTVKPGITGLAQVNGRNTISWEQKFKYDVEYADNLSFLLDLNIFLKTFFKILERKGIDFEVSYGTKEFLGTEKKNI